jgi:subfamily B ATP-binding cassette protein MsbA
MGLTHTFKRIVGLLKPYKGRLMLALGGMIVTAATEPAVAAMMKLLLDKGFSQAHTFSLWLVPLFVIGIFVIIGCCCRLSCPPFVIVRRSSLTVYLCRGP